MRCPIIVRVAGSWIRIDIIPWILHLIAPQTSDVSSVFRYSMLYAENDGRAEDKKTWTYPFVFQFPDLVLRLDGTINPHNPAQRISHLTTYVTPQTSLNGSFSPTMDPPPVHAVFLVTFDQRVGCVSTVPPQSNKSPSNEAHS